jgi:hypothetical protein
MDKYKYKKYLSKNGQKGGEKPIYPFIFYPGTIDISNSANMDYFTSKLGGDTNNLNQFMNEHTIENLYKLMEYMDTLNLNTYDKPTLLHITIGSPFEEILNEPSLKIHSDKKTIFSLALHQIIPNWLLSNKISKKIIIISPRKKYTDDDIISIKNYLNIYLGNIEITITIYDRTDNLKLSFSDNDINTEIYFCNSIVPSFYKMDGDTKIYLSDNDRTFVESFYEKLNLLVDKINRKGLCILFSYAIFINITIPKFYLLGNMVEFKNKILMCEWKKNNYTDPKNIDTLMIIDVQSYENYFLKNFIQTEKNSIHKSIQKNDIIINSKKIPRIATELYLSYNIFNVNLNTGKYIYESSFPDANIFKYINKNKYIFVVYGLLFYVNPENNKLYFS